MKPKGSSLFDWSNLRRTCLTGLLRLALGGVFFWAGGRKLLDPAQFSVAVSHYRILPPALDNLVAITLPWLEVVAGVFVLMGIWVRAATLIIASLTAAFLLAIGVALARGLNIECGCFGTVGGRPIGLFSLALDALLLLLAGVLLKRSGPARQRD